MGTGKSSSRPAPDRPRRGRFRASLERLESRKLLATIPVTNTNDSGPGSLRGAIQQANANPGADSIVFRLAPIPADVNGPDDSIPGFNPISQTWRIVPTSPLPRITDPVTIDGYTQAQFPIPYRYPQQTSPDPVLIASTPNTIPARDGNNAVVRVIVDGSRAGGVGFEVGASHSAIRGMAIDGFGVGVSVATPGVVGTLIQGNFIGQYFLFSVDSATGEPLVDAARVTLGGRGNASEGVRLGSTNATVGGASPQENNVITGNGAQGVSILPGGVGNQVIGNQIGIAGPTSNGRYAIAPNGAEGVLIAGTLPRPGSTNYVIDNLISGNSSHGVRIVGAQALGPAAVDNQIKGNYIGVGPGGGFVFGVLDTGNLGDGIRIEDAGSNIVGGPAAGDQNVISANEGAGIRIFGMTSSGNRVLGNLVGLTAGGSSALGNSQEGVAIGSAGNVVGPGNVVSANLRGVLLSGPGATGNLVFGNRIGTDASGLADLGNAFEGVRIDGASDNQVVGDASGSQVISGNNVGVMVVGASASRNRVAGNFIGTDVSGTVALGNSQEGVRIEDSPGNAVGGTVAADRNVISANHWGVVLVGGVSINNFVQGNFIGTDTSGTLPLGNELDGVLITNAASDNGVGGNSVEAGNLIAFNFRDGVRIEGSSVRNRVLTNRIFANAGLGINLVGSPGVDPNDPGDGDAGPNFLQNFPIVTGVTRSANSATVQGTLFSTPNTVFLIQLFANARPDPTGLLEGERFLGQLTVTTGADGFADFSAEVPAVAPNEAISATATDPSGNTSEFPSLQSIVQFQVNAFAVTEADGQATIVVTRLGETGGTVTVRFATFDGTATAGLDYLPASGVLVFGPGETSKTFTIPILRDTGAEGDETVLLGLFDPTGFGVVRPSPSAILVIREPADLAGPRVASVRAIAGRRGVAAVIVAFDELLDPARAVDLVNYGYSVRIAGRDGRIGTRDDLLIGLFPATYDPAARTITLPLTRAVRDRMRLKLLINQATDVAGAGKGVADLAGNLLDGDGDGRPGGAFSAVLVARPAPKRRRDGAKAPIVGQPTARRVAVPASRPRGPGQRRGAEGISE